jgi:hypothetical protein
LGDLLAQAQDLVVLGGQPGHRLVPERRQVPDLAVAVGDAGGELGYLGLEPVDPGVARVAELSGVALLLAAALEVVLEVAVGAVEGGSAHAGVAGQGLDVAASPGRELPVQEPVRGGADVVLGVAALLLVDPQWVCPSGWSS